MGAFDEALRNPQRGFHKKSIAKSTAGFLFACFESFHYSNFLFFVFKIVLHFNTIEKHFNRRCYGLRVNPKP